MTRIVKKTATLPEKVIGLLRKGVRMTNPFSVEIGDDVDLERISNSLTIYGAARIYGETTLIADDVNLGYEAPVTLINCQLGAAVELKGGYFADSVFLEKAIMGSNAHIRAGCLLEEETSGNHTVGLKQTILFPFVTLGSLINFCDCLMAGGTSRKNHSEVGSSYIHFNYTPWQDKATASLIGDVSRGVMLKESPIFLGGQGGMVGPRQIDYGTVIPAGTICREDSPGTGLVWSSAESSVPVKEFDKVSSGDIRHKVYLNILYIANLLALKQWYIHVRQDFFREQKYGNGLYLGALLVLDEAIVERLNQMRSFAGKVEAALLSASSNKKRIPAVVSRQQKEFLLLWPQMEKYLGSVYKWKPGLKKEESFLKIIRAKLPQSKSYLETIKSLTPEQAKMGSDWLNSIVDEVVSQCWKKDSVLGRKNKV